MPIGKNSIKRVANNGYSKVNSSAPDMENSTVIANPSPEVIERMIPSSRKPAAAKKSQATSAKTGAAKKKTAAKSAPKKEKAAEKASAAKEEKVEEKVEAVSYVLVGRELPIHLL